MEANRDRRARMVERQIAARGVRDPAVLAAMRSVPREAFLPEPMAEFAYDDSPLPIAEGQTISQPYIVALMVAALELDPSRRPRVLEIGTGSGYAAAVLAEVATEVYTVERHGRLAERAQRVLAELGYDNVRVRHGDGTLGWAEHAPYDGIVVAAGGPEVPDSLRRQLAVGGRLVIPVGDDRRNQRLLRVTRVGTDEVREEDLGPVAFVPLVGAEGWREYGDPAAKPAAPRSSGSLAERIAAAAEPIAGADDADLDGLLDRIGDARAVLLGEASHGTSEFYRFRAALTRQLIERKGFRIVALEADWPDAGRIDHYVRHSEAPPAEWTAFSRFPTWMWRNREFRRLVDWLHDHNRDLEPDDRVRVHGLDLYSMYTSIDSVLSYLDDVDPQAARVARERYGCLTPYQSDPTVYGRAALAGRYQECEHEVTAMLRDLLEQRVRYSTADGERFLDAVHNARLVTNAERYYRVMYYGAAASWNLRDQHMFDTLKLLLDGGGGDARAVVWAHNSHLGDASATEMAARGEHNLGQLTRRELGSGAYLVGFGTHDGTVAAASTWGGEMEVKEVRPSDQRSYERLCHDSGVSDFLLPLRPPDELSRALLEPRLERAIGVIYRPETERASHYFHAILPRQFDEWVWLDRTHAVAPLATAELAGEPDTYPFGV